MSVIDELLEGNSRSAARYPATTTVARPRLALVLCMDARIDPWRAFGLEKGSAHLIRNAGGRVADAVRSLVVSQVMFGTEAVAIVHHTDCGMLTFTDEAMRLRLREQRGAIADHVAFLPFTDLDEAVRDDLEIYRQSPLLRQDIPVRGFVFDVATGLLREVAGRPQTSPA